MAHTWSLAVDMQLFIIAPFLIYLLWRWPKIGLEMLITLILASIGVIFGIYFVTEMPPRMITRRL